MKIGNKDQKLDGKSKIYEFIFDAEFFRCPKKSEIGTTMAQTTERFNDLALNIPNTIKTDLYEWIHIIFAYFTLN